MGASGVHPPDVAGPLGTGPAVQRGTAVGNKPEEIFKNIRYIIIGI